MQIDSSTDLIRGLSGLPWHVKHLPLLLRLGSILLRLSSSLPLGLPCYLLSPGWLCFGRPILMGFGLSLSL